MCLSHVEVKVKFTNPSAGTESEETALVDTGVTLAVLPRKVAQALRLVPKATSKAVTAGFLPDPIVC